MKKFVLVAVAVALEGCVFAAAGDVECPVSENVRGRENVEWSVGYSYHLTDG